MVLGLRVYILSTVYRFRSEPSGMYVRQGVSSLRGLELFSLVVE